jgi:hypothetical protein
MSRLIISILFFVFLLNSYGQLCSNPQPYSVEASSGLKMRSAPGIGNQVVKYIPKDSIVLVCSELGPEATIEKITGNWRMVTYKGASGYLFDGFLKPVFEDVLDHQNDSLNQPLSKQEDPLSQPLSKQEDSSAVASRQVQENEIEKSKSQNQKPAVEKQSPLKYHLLTETYNYCGNIAEVDPGLIWYAIFREGETSYLKRREVMVLKSKYALTKNLEFDIRTEDDENAGLFLIGFKQYIALDTTNPIVVHENLSCDLPRKLFPGMQKTLFGKIPGIHKENVLLYATGHVKDVGICPEMAGYSLKISSEKFGQPIMQELNPLIRDMGMCGMPELFWFGDLNGDGYPEMLFVTQRPEANQFILLTSDHIDNDKLYRRAAVWTIYNCD